ncbi:MAG: hypothetical protein KKA42_06660 [candidate division Zixibacteria bacterium]|nr:hypothetical protein [candidate division Zixibacteria bacterium]
MEDYETTNHSVYFNANYRASEKLGVFGAVTFNKSTAELNEVQMPELAADAAAALSHQDFDFTDMYQYSDLDFSFIRVGAGFEYMLSPTVTWTTDADYTDLTDDAGYVYGIESGSLIMVRSGVQIDF